MPRGHGASQPGADAPPTPTSTRDKARGLALRALTLALLTGGAGAAQGRPYKPGEFTPAAKLQALAKKVGARATPIVHPEALAAARAKLAAKQGLRVLQLGDSHIAADYISGMTRHELQAAFGDGGRGFMHIDQRWGFGGRKTRRPERPWVRDRIVDPHRAGRRFGFSGLSLDSARAGATIRYQLLPEDGRLALYYEAQPKGGKLQISVGGKVLTVLDTRAPRRESRRLALALPTPRPPDKKRPGATLQLKALGPRVRLYGIALERATPGLIWESVGPVGADAKVYLQLNQDSLVEQLKAHQPDLVVLMVGGNDALKIRKRWTTLKKVRADHVQLLAGLKQALPDAACLVMTPMDAGRRRGRKVVSKPHLEAVRAMQKEVAAEAGCALWDTMEAMGGPGSIARWTRAKVMNRDLVHPRKAAADLLGHLFAQALKPALGAP